MYISKCSKLNDLRFGLKTDLYRLKQSHNHTRNQSFDLKLFIFGVRILTIYIKILKKYGNMYKHVVVTKCVNLSQVFVKHM